MPKLDIERNHPPGSRAADETAAQDPETDEHDEGIPVVQRLRGHEPGEPESQHAAGLFHWPVERVDLQGLRQMLGPMRQDDRHENLETALMPRAVETLSKGLL